MEQACFLLKPYEAYTGRQKKNWSRFSWAAFALAFLYMLWRAPYGFASFDESFHLSVAYRLTQGAALFAEEWHGSQMSGFLLYPLMRLFLAVNPDGEGMVLTFRYAYAVVAALVGLFVYFSSRKICPPAALAASLMLMLFAPYSVRALNYNSMGVLLVSAACFSAAAREPNRRNMALCGLFFAGAVLCCPYLLGVFLIYALSVPVVGWLARKQGKQRLYAFSGPGFFAFCLGAGILFVLFCAFLFSRTGIRELLENIPYILNDPEHGSVDFLYNCKRYLGAFFRSSSDAPAVIFACGALLAVLALDRGRSRRRGFYLLVSLLLTAVYCRQTFIDPNVNCFMFPLCIPGFFAFLLCREKQWGLFTQVFVPGLLYSICMHFTSNQWYYAICQAFAVSSAASVFFLAQLARELTQGREMQGRKALPRLAPLALALLLLGQLSVQVVYGMIHVDYEPSVWKLDCRVENGIQKGVITEAAKEQRYQAVLADTAAMRQEEGNYSLYFSDDIWLMLGDKKPTAAYSAWLGFEAPELSAKRVLEYWRLYPEKLPENIYVKKEFYYGYRESFYGESLVPLFAALGYDLREGETGWFLRRIS